MPTAKFAHDTHNLTSVLPLRKLPIAFTATSQLLAMVELGLFWQCLFPTTAISCKLQCYFTVTLWRSFWNRPLLSWKFDMSHNRHLTRLLQNVDITKLNETVTDSAKNWFLSWKSKLEIEILINEWDTSWLRGEWQTIKPIVLVNSENYKFLSEWVVSVLIALCIILSETINILRKLHKTKIFWMPPRFYHRVMYKAPSTGHGLLNLNLPFKLMLRRFEVVFWCLEWECCTFGKIDKNTLRSTNIMLWL